jgi:hypothetical protein
VADPKTNYLKNTPRILLFDLETFPNLYYSWRLWEGRTLDTLEFSYVCCFSAKWLNGKHITKALPDYSGNQEAQEYGLLSDLWKLVDEADIIIAHNGRAFDFGRMNSQFIKHGFNPPSPAQKIDTKRVAKEVFGFDSNSLDGLCQFMGLGHKMDTGGYELWRSCMAGDPKAWARMKKYNTHDVVLLEKLYLKLRPWMPKHPNVTLFKDRGQCPKCGAEKLWSRGIYRSATREYQRYQCTECGGWSRAVRSSKSTKITNTNA